MLFDGVCPLCSASTRFLLRHERTSDLRFAAVQSELGQAILTGLGMPTDAYETFLLIEHGRVFAKSEAALRLTTRLRWPWRWLGIGRILPRGLADWLYDRVARNRYALFGRYETCRLPAPGQAERFLE